MMRAAPALLLTSLLLLSSSPALAANPAVRIATPLGNIDLELCEATSAQCPTAAPLTVANFLTYVDEGAYVDSFVHRRVRNFVIQGGSFTTDFATDWFQIPTHAPVPSEFTPGPPSRNVRGTVSVPLPSDPPGSTNPCDTGENAGTSGWFINLADTNASLDCGLFTVFAVVTSGMDVADAINSLFAVNFGLGPSPMDSGYVCAPNANNQCTNLQWWSHLIGTEITRVPEPEAIALGLVVLPALALFARCRAR